MMQKEPMGMASGPVNIGNSVMAIKYKGGILIAADCAVSYGGMKKVKNASRMATISDNIAYACSGEMSDFQEVRKMLQTAHENDIVQSDGRLFYQAKQYYNHLSNVLYQRRMKMKPLWVSTIMAGVDRESGEQFLGQLDLYGTKVTGKYLLTGIAAHYC